MCKAHLTVLVQTIKRDSPVVRDARGSIVNMSSRPPHPTKHLMWKYSRPYILQVKWSSHFLSEKRYIVETGNYSDSSDSTSDTDSDTDSDTAEVMCH